MKKVHICPHLGKEDDPSTPILFPSPFNSCFRAPRSIKPDLEHQSATCLAAEHHKCPAFINVYDINRVPMYQSPQEKRSRTGKTIILLSLVALFLFLLFVNLIALGVIPAFEPEDTPTPTSTLPLPTVPILPTVEYTALPPQPTSTVTPAVTAIIPNTSVLTRTSASSPTAISKVYLDTPFGSDPRLIIHRVKSGESLNLFANRYSSSVSAIQWVNFNLPSPLQVDYVVVIPIGTPEIDPNIPPFETYQVLTAGVQAHELAAELDTDLDQFLHFNALEAETVLPSGHWLVIPRPRP